MFVNDSLSFVIHCFNWPLPSEHHLYEQYPSMEYITLSNLISVTNGYQLCSGISSDISGTEVVIHAAPQKIHPFSQHYLQSFFRRSRECLVLINNDDAKCKYCFRLERKLRSYNSFNVKRSSLSSATPAKLKAPISKTNPVRVVKEKT